MQITIPFCYLPNSKVQVFDMDTCRRSLFQVQFLETISKQEDFAFFVTNDDCGAEYIIAPEFHCKVLVAWYTKDGAAHWADVGLRTMLKHCSRAGVPDALDSVVYTCRIKEELPA